MRQFKQVAWRITALRWISATGAPEDRDAFMAFRSSPGREIAAPPLSAIQVSGSRAIRLWLPQPSPDLKTDLADDNARQRIDQSTYNAGIQISIS